MVFDYKIIPVKNEILNGPNEIKGFSKRRKTVTRKIRKDRRKSTHDRRDAVRDGVVVSLSFDTNRRKGPDRRQKSNTANRRKGQDRRQVSGSYAQKDYNTGIVV